MAILVFQNDPYDPPARLGDVLRDHGHTLKVFDLFDGDPLPADLDDAHGLLVMGGRQNVSDMDTQPDAYPYLAGQCDLIRRAHEAGLPVVGICLGAQLIARALGGKVEAMERPEVGWGEVQLAFPGTIDPVYAGMPWKTMQFHAHGDQVSELPPGATPLASSRACRQQAFKVGLTTYAFQYHFEWSRSGIERWLEAEHNAAWCGRHGIESGPILAGLDEHFEMYEHLGQRLCKQVCGLLYKLEHRLSHRSGVLDSFSPAVS